MTDQPFLHAWLHARLAAGGFHHRHHLELARLVVDRHGPGHMWGAESPIGRLV